MGDLGTILGLILLIAVFWWMGDQSAKDREQVAELTAELCLAVEGEDFFMCHAKCSELPEHLDRHCINHYAELITNVGSDSTE